ncbi:MAG: 5-methyltetrahydropteroyltriglutamate--homocysteine S-methyltransferase [Hyphomicrobiaceae bacterium]
MATKPPFRADHVGSILRSVPLKEARARREAGQITAEQLKTVEDAEILKIIRKQEEAGLKGITDGEYRRAWWHYDFLGGLDGVNLETAEQGIQFKGVQTKAQVPMIRGRIGFSKSHPFIEHFKFVKANTKQTPKMTIPSPSMLYYRGGRGAIGDGLYPDQAQYWRDLGQAYNDAVKAFYDEGCRYLQIDDCSFAYFCDPAQLKMLSDRGDDPKVLPGIFADMINAAVASKPDDMVTSIHVCRGNFRSTFVSSGGYEPIADLLFNKTNVDAYFLEWDSDRAGDLSPLRFLPKNKKVVLGLVTTKTGTLEPKDAIRRRIDEATKYVGLDQLCLSPQCGFASTEEGNVLAEEEQWAKLALVVELAKEVWGEV